MTSIKKCITLHHKPKKTNKMKKVSVVIASLIFVAAVNAQTAPAKDAKAPAKDAKKEAKKEDKKAEPKKDDKAAKPADKK